MGRKKLEDMLLAKYAESGEAEALQAARAMASTANAKLTPESETDQLLAAGKREEAAKLLISTARRATGEERDRLLAQLAALYESTGDWRKAAGAWRKIAEEGNAEYREAATFDWIRTTAAIGRNADGVEDMWLKFLRDHPTSPRGHLAVTRLAEMMVLQERADEAAVLLNGWLNSSEGTSAGAAFVSMRLAELQQQQEETEKEGGVTSFAQELEEAAAKLPAELISLCDLARTGKRTGKILNRIRDIRRELAGSVADPVLILQLDRAEALALNGQRESRRALDLLEDTWSKNSELLASKDAAVHLAAIGLAGDAIGIALEAGNHPSVLVWAERIAGAAFPPGQAEVDLLKDAALRLVRADAKTEGMAVLSILGNQLLARLTDGSRIRTEGTATVARLKTLCANGAAVTDNEWFTGEIPAGQGSAVARALFEADLLFAARETEDASRAYSDVIRGPGIDVDTEGYATLQLARCLAALGEHAEALRTYRRFEDNLGEAKSAAAALLRAGTLCGGPMNDSRGAHGFFAMVSAVRRQL